MLALSIAFLFSVNVVDASITVDYVGHDSGSLNSIIAGETHYSRAEFSQPYGEVFWYVKSPGQSGLGTHVDTDSGDGRSTVSRFSHTFNSGSPNGKNYKITAYVYPLSDAQDQSVDEDSYTVTVWTPPEDVITVPNELSISDDIRVGDSYEFSVDASFSSSNYLITKIEVFVDDALTASQRFSGIRNAAIDVSGFLSRNAGSTLSVKAKITGFIKKKLTPGTVIIFTLKKTWEGVLRGTVFGRAICFNDENPLDSTRVSYRCYNPSPRIYYRYNRSYVEWDAGSISGNQRGSDATDSDGEYSFPQTVPFGYNIGLSLSANDLHLHELENKTFSYRICRYSENRGIGEVGTVKLRYIPIRWNQVEQNFTVPPNSTTDPCDGKGTQKNPNEG